LTVLVLEIMMDQQLRGSLAHSHDLLLATTFSTYEQKEHAKNKYIANLK